MMTFKEFMDEVVAKITNYLPEGYKDAEVSISEITKNNDTVLHGMTIRRKDERVSPTIYLEPYYNKDYDGTNLDSVLKSIANVRKKNGGMEAMDDALSIIDNIANYDKIKEHIVPRLLGAEQNQTYVSDKPFTTVGDFIVTYHIFIDAQKSIAVNNKIADSWGVTAPELHKVALDNINKISPVTFQDIREVLLDAMVEDYIKNNNVSREAAEAFVEEILPPMPSDASLFVLSNKSRMYGAASILSSEVMDMVTEKVGGDFYILPSSVHEVLIVPKGTSSANTADLENMVQEVNGKEVMPEERLSNYVYSYNPETKTVYRLVA